jgi:hypothetical protein
MGFEGETGKLNFSVQIEFSNFMKFGLKFLSNSQI